MYLIGQLLASYEIIFRRWLTLERAVDTWQIKINLFEQLASKNPGPTGLTV